VKKKSEKGKKLRHTIYAVYYTVHLPLPQYNVRIRDSTTATATIAQLSKSLRLKITRIDVDVKAVMNSNREQGHQSHTPHYQK
jgi:hypothetical protein